MFRTYHFGKKRHLGTSEEGKKLSVENLVQVLLIKQHKKEDCIRLKITCRVHYYIASRGGKIKKQNRKV